MKKASVIIPVYNQKNSIYNVINGFCKQTLPSNCFEVIIVDDGSTDVIYDSDFCKQFDVKINIVNIEHSGRSCARNIGAKCAKNEILIFCDGDRVPDVNFVEQHLLNHFEDCRVGVGSAYDYYGLRSITEECEGNIRRYSKIPVNYKKLYSLIELKDSDLYWLAFLVGNLSINKELFWELGGFNENFKDWGLEHIELGYRLYKKNVRFRYISSAINFHIPHKRNSEIVKEALLNSAEIFKELHSEVNVEIIVDFFCGKVAYDYLVNNYGRYND